jgi:hypothetical protein
MVKVLIYSSKQIYDTATYEGRAEADFVAYRRDDGYYEIVKNRSGRHFSKYLTSTLLELEILGAERDEFNRELKNYELSDRYKMHQYITITKNIVDKTEPKVYTDSIG